MLANLERFIQRATSSVVALAFVALLVLTSVGLVWAAPTPPNDPDPDFPVTNGEVSALLPAADGSIYVGGNFTIIDPTPALHGASINTGTGEPNTVSSDTVPYPDAVISDGNGGWYVAADNNKISHILPDGTVDPAFQPVINGIVDALLLSNDGTTLYVAGLFTQVNGSVTRNRLAAFNTSDGALTDFNPNFNNRVVSLALTADDSTLYAGGQFTQVNGSVTRNCLAAFNTALDTGNVTNFNPNVFGVPSPLVRSLALTSDDSTLYAGGIFALVGSGGPPATRNNLAAFSTALDTGNVTDFNPNIGGNVYDVLLTPDNSTLYISGSFTQVNGSVTRNRLAAFNTALDTGNVTNFDPDINSITDSLALSPDGQTLYAGGSFTQVNGSVARNYLAAFNTALATGNVTSFDARIVNNGVNQMALSPDGGTLFAVDSNGDMFLGGVNRNRLARILPNGTVDPTFNPNINGSVTTLALSPDGQTLYAGGSFTQVNGSTTRNRVAAFSASTGAVQPLDVDVNNTVNRIVLSKDGQTLYVGGSFTQINGTTAQNYVAAFTTTTGVATSFAPAMVSAVNALALTSDDSTLYIGGGFSGAVFLRAFDTATEAPTAFSPIEINAPVSALALASDDDTIYVAGFFSGYLYAFDTGDSSAIPGFAPSITPPIRNIVLTEDNNTLYVAGSFGGFIRGLDTATGTATWTPLVSGPVDTVALNRAETAVYIGGSFYALNNIPQPYLACYGECYTDPPVPPLPPTPGSGGDNGNGSLAPTGFDHRLPLFIASLLLGSGVALLAGYRRYTAKHWLPDTKVGRK